MPTEKRVPSASSTSKAREPSLVPPCPFEMFEHAGLAVAKALDLQERGRPPDLVARAGPAEHQALASQRFDPHQFFAQRVRLVQTVCSWAFR